MGLFRAISDGLEKFETVIVSLGLLFMVILAFLQVILRNFWDTGISWGNQTVQALVLWVGFLGASIATHQRGHIRFDVVSKFLPPKIKKVAEFIVHFASAFVCVLLAKAAYNFVLMEREFPTASIGKIPSWVPMIIMPIGFITISFRMAVYGLDDLIGGIKEWITFLRKKRGEG